MSYPFYLRLTSYLGTLLLISTFSACTPLRTQELQNFELAQSQQESPSSETNLRQIAQSITVGISHDNQSGSGILIAKQGNTYKVLTNAHIARDENASYQIQTPDGQTYQAQLVRRGDSFEGKDLALLEFEAPADYSTAQFGSRQSLQRQQTVLAAGFPINKKEMAFSKGKITLLPEQPLKGGYQIGYSNKIQQGMSGGPMLNEAGEVVGINGLGQAAVLDETYTFEDGSTPREEQRRAFREASWSVPLEVSSLAKIDPQLAAQQVNDIAKAVTVRIDAEKGNGSGVIVAHEGNTYWVLTAEHVVSKEGNYQVVTPDGKNHAVDYETVQSKEGIDVALLQFSSPETYSVATLGNYSLGGLRERPLVFLSGFPGSNPEKRSFTAGTTSPQVFSFTQVQNQSSLSSGYGLVYSNFSQRGMSGGPVLDSRGHVIGINTASEAKFEITEAGKVKTVNLGLSLGVPMRRFLGLAPEIGMETENFKVKTSPPPEFSESEVEAITEGLFTVDSPAESATAIDWLNYGNRLWRVGKNEKAVNAFERAIELQPEFYQAYYAKGKALMEQGPIYSYGAASNSQALDEKNKQVAQEKLQQAVAAFEKATKINTNLYEAWRDRSKVLSFLKQRQEALALIDKAIAINPEDFTLHLRRGQILQSLDRIKEAEKAYSEAIALKHTASTYLFRATIRTQLPNSFQGAIADFNKVIELQPQFAFAYSLRGIARSAIGNEKGALADASKAIELQPQDSYLYLLRSEVYSNLGNYQKALADLNQAIELQPRNSSLYQARAEAYHNLGNFEKALADINQAIELQPQINELYPNRADIYVHLENYKKALADLKQTLTMQSQQGKSQQRKTYQNVLKVYSKLGAYKQALADFSQAIESQPKNSLLYLFRAEIYSRLENYNQALADLNQAITLQPRNRVIRQSRATTHYKLGNYKKALADFNQAIALQPRNSSLHHSRATTHYKLGNYEKALADLNQVIALDPDNVTAYVDRAVTHDELGNLQKVIQDLQKAAELYRQQGKQKRYQQIQKKLRELQAQ